MTARALAQPPKSILLFNDECAVCRTIGHWVNKSALRTAGGPRLMVQPIGDDPEVLRALNPDLDIWDAYDTIHLLMRDGTMKTGGEAVAEVLRDLPSCGWLAWAFAVRVFWVRPFQWILNFGYLVLSDLRPLLGCESCGMPNHWVKHIAALITRIKGVSAKSRHPTMSPHGSSARG